MAGAGLLLLQPFAQGGSLGFGLLALFDFLVEALLQGKPLVIRGHRRGKTLRGGLLSGIGQPGVALVQEAVAPREDIGFGGQRLGLLEVALA
ncbi:hypothetical protein D3C81_1952970 [compost metagenome]